MGIFNRLFGSRATIEDVDIQATAAALDQSGIQVIDCRSEREWRSGHLKGSMLMPLDSIGSRMNELDKELPVIVVCRSGHRSSIAARQLAEAGFIDVKSMKGGLNAWSRSGNPLVS